MAHQRKTTSPLSLGGRAAGLCHQFITSASEAHETAAGFLHYHTDQGRALRRVFPPNLGPPLDHHGETGDANVDYLKYEASGTECSWSLSLSRLALPQSADHWASSPVSEVVGGKASRILPAGCQCRSIAMRMVPSGASVGRRIYPKQISNLGAEPTARNNSQHHLR